MILIGIIVTTSPQNDISRKICILTPMQNLCGLDTWRLNKNIVPGKARKKLPRAMGD